MRVLWLSIYLITILSLSNEVSAQLTSSISDSIYHEIRREYLGDRAEEISQYTRLQLEEYGIQGDYLYYAYSLVGRANYTVGNYRRALRILNEIPVDSIKHEGTFYDIHLGRAYFHHKNREFLKADSVFSEWVPQVPDVYKAMLAIAYTNWSLTRNELYDYEGSLKYTMMALDYNKDLTDLQSKLRHLRLLHNAIDYFIDVNDNDQAIAIYKSMEPFDQVEAKLIYEKAKGRIQIIEKNYEEAAATFKALKLRAEATNYFVYADYASKYAKKSLLLYQANQKEQLERMATYFIITVIGVGLALYSAWNRRRESEEAFKEISSF